MTYFSDNIFKRIFAGACVSAALLMLVGCGKTKDSFYAANVDADFSSYELIVENSSKTTLTVRSTGEKYEFSDDGVQQRTAEEIAPLLDKLRSVGVKKISSDVKSEFPTVTKIRMCKADGSCSEISLITANGANSDAVFCLEISDGSETDFYELSESDWEEIANLFASCYYGNDLPPENT